MNTEFRNIRDDELDASHQIIIDATEWLLSKGIRQWTCVLPRGVWDERQKKGQNFGLFADGDLAVIMSLIDNVHPKWTDELGEVSQLWLYTLATAAEFRGNGLGNRAVGEAETHLQKLGVDALVLDCIASGFLPGFYESLGYELLARKDITYPLGTFDCALMRKEL